MQLPELRDVASDQQATAPALNLEIDREAASRFGIQTQAINDALYNAFGQRQVTQFYTQISRYKVIIEVPPELQAIPRRSTNSSCARRSRAGRCRCRHW